MSFIAPSFRLCLSKSRPFKSPQGKGHQDQGALATGDTLFSQAHGVSLVFVRDILIALLEPLTDSKGPNPTSMFLTPVSGQTVSLGNLGLPSSLSKLIGPSSPSSEVSFSQGSLLRLSCCGGS